MTRYSAPFDPLTVPVQRAATVLLVDDRPELQVLCLRRRTASNFVGGMTVFPGGGIDKGDEDPAYRDRMVGLTVAAATDRLATPDALAYWVAVVRETLEEVGVLLACDVSGLGCSEQTAHRHRHDVDGGHRSLLDVLAEEELSITGDAIVDVGRWITPIGPPRRYDTRFFTARMPAGQTAVVDAVEAVFGEWRRPADALEEWRAGTLVMLPPTVAWLRVLNRFASADRFLAAAGKGQGPGGSPCVIGDDRGSFRVVLPDEIDDDHAEAREALGWIYDAVLGGPSESAAP